MKKVFNFKKEIPLEESISNITSISLDTTFNECVTGVEGVFLISGNYKTHELSLNKKDFKYELNFDELIENVIEGSLNLEVEDFTYEIVDDNLVVDIDYEVSYEEKEEMEEELDEEEFERFLEEHEVDIVNLNEIEEQTEINTQEITEEESEPEIETIEEKEEQKEEEEKRDVNLIPQEENDESETSDVILKSIDKEEKYITYHVYVCEEDDTFESISEKFKTTKEEIREYNEIDDIEYGRKIIIPVKDE